MRRRFPWFPATLIVLAGLSNGVPPALALSANHRLGHEAVPLAETVRLRLDPDSARYTGAVTLTLAVAAPTDSFQLHARELDLRALRLRGPAGEVATTHGVDAHDLLTVRTRPALAPGRYTLEIEFGNRFNTRANSLYRLTLDGRGYCFTQFESQAAREAFPCFDEPEFKIPWQVELSIPAGQMAVSNMPVARDSTAGGRRMVRFETSPPLPSYLVAIAAGPLESVPIPGMSVPGHVITVRGRSGLAGEAVTWTPRLIAALERWFGRRYPYPKLDLLAVPEFWAGAMENPGAITFREERLLVDPRAPSVDQRSHLITTTAHELAHMWFGDLVTMAWWDDLWLNESFASWMGRKVSAEVAPDLELAIDQTARVQQPMQSDAQPSTHAIRHEVDAFGSMDESFDPIVYDKGEAVLDMLEQWLGPDLFRRGVRDYIAAHLHGNATESDLWAALSRVSRRDVEGPARSFVDQAGIPVVRVEPAGAHRVRLTQRRLMNAGVEEPGRTLWQIPITLRYGSAGGATRTRTLLLADSAQTLTLEDDATWLWPNADARGYYRFSLPPEWRVALADRAQQVLSPRERIAMAGNVPAMLIAGRLRGDEALRLLGRFAADPQPQVVGTVLDGLRELRVPLVPASLADAWAGYVRRSLGPAMERIGPSPRPGEAAAVSLLRPRLVRTLGEDGRDPAVMARAESLCAAYLRDPSALDPSLVEATLQLAAIHGDSARFEIFRRRFENASVPADRARFLAALGAFHDPSLVRRLLDYALSGAMRPQEVGGVFRSVGESPENEGVLFDWVKRDWTRITAGLPPFARVFLVTTAGGCSTARLEEARAFFLDPARKGPGTERALARVADGVHDCASLREREGPAVERWLTGLAGAR